MIYTAKNVCVCVAITDPPVLGSNYNIGDAIKMRVQHTDNIMYGCSRLNN